MLAARLSTAYVGHVVRQLMCDSEWRRMWFPLGPHVEHPPVILLMMGYIVLHQVHDGAGLIPSTESDEGIKLPESRYVTSCSTLLCI